MINLKNKVALITGASSGIGETTTLALAQAGVKVLATARRSDRLNAVIDRVKTQGGHATALVNDISQPGEAERAVDATLNAYGRIDILINNAGVMLLSPIAEAKLSDWQTMIDTNVTGLMALTHAALPHLLKNKSSDVINISSVAGRIARKNAGGYNATKFAVNAFSEALRQENCDKGLRVTVIEPGLVATELLEHIPNPETLKTYRTFAESLTRLTAQDITNTIVFVLSQPAHVTFREILVCPTEQSYP